MMKKLTAIMKSLTSVMIVGLYLFSGTSGAAGTCGIGYIDLLLYRTGGSPDTGSTVIEVSVDSTGFKTPSQTPAHDIPNLTGRKSIALWWVASLEQFNQALGLLKMAFTARLPVRIYTSDSDCKGPVNEFQIFMCMNESDCNIQ